MAQISFLPNKAYPSIPTIGADLESHSRALEAIREALQIHERRSKDVMSSFVRVEELIDMGLVELEKGSDTSVPTVVDDNPTEEPTSHRHDSLYIRLDGSSPPTDGEIDIGAGILMSNAQPINWLDAAAVSVEMIQFEEQDVVAAELTHEHLRYTPTTPITLNNAGTYETVTGRTLSAASMNAGNDVLILAQTQVSKASGGDNIFTQMIGPTGLLTGSEASQDTAANGSLLGYAYGWMGKITADGTDVSLQGKPPNGVDGYWFVPNMLALDLTELGASAQYTESSTEITDVTAGSWISTNSSLTFGDGAKDYLVFWAIQTNEDQNLGTSNYRITDGVTTFFLGGYTGGGTAEIINQAGFFTLAAPASGTWTLQYWHKDAGLNPDTSDVTYTALCAIDLDAFHDHIAAEAIPPNAAWDNLDVEVTANGVTSTTTAMDWFLMAEIVPTAWNVTSEGHSLQLQYSDTGGAGYAALYHHSDIRVGNATENPQAWNLFEGVAAVADGTDFYARVQHYAAPNAVLATDHASISAFTWNLADSIEETFIVGDPSYATRIDGLTTNITSPATDIDGTLNVDGTSAFNADVDLTTNAILTIWDAANTDKATITIKGDDLDIVGVGLSDLDIGGFTLARFQDVNVRISSSIGDTNYIEFEADGTDILATCYGTGSFIFRDIPDWIWIEDGCGLSIGADQTGTKNLYMFHDGTDFEFDFDGTTDWNISGITAINAGTVDADFDAITATSYGGILEANLLSRIVAEPISGAWVFNGELTFTDKLNAHVTTVTATSFTADDDHVILVDDDTAASTVTITLPPAATANTIYHVKKLGSTANVIVDADGSETIDGSLTAVLTLQYESIMLISDGTNWNIL